MKDLFPRPVARQLSTAADLAFQSFAGGREGCLGVVDNRPGDLLPDLALGPEVHRKGDFLVLGFGPVESLVEGGGRDFHLKKGGVDSLQQATG